MPSSSPVEVKFDQYSGYWIGFWGDTVMWVSPDSEEIQYVKVPRLRKGYTFYTHTQSPRFQIVLARNELGEVIAFFNNPDEDIRFALMVDDPDRSEWGTIPLITDNIEGEP